LPWKLCTPHDLRGGGWALSQQEGGRGSVPNRQHKATGAKGSKPLLVVLARGRARPHHLMGLFAEAIWQTTTRALPPEQEPEAHAPGTSTGTPGPRKKHKAKS